jgi:hypothetical protein
MEIEFVTPHESIDKRVHCFVYACDWGGEGDIRIATVGLIHESDDWEYSYVVEWDGDYPNELKRFPTFYHAKYYIYSHSKRYERWVLQKAKLAI